MLRTLPPLTDMIAGIDAMLPTVAVPLPPLTVNIARLDMKSTVISIVGSVISFHHDLQKIGCVSTTLSTGGGFMQLGDLRQDVHVFAGGTALLQEHSVDGQAVFAPAFLSVYHNTATEVRPAGCAWVHVGELLKAACAGETLSVAGYLYASDGKSPVTAVQVQITPDPLSAPMVERWRKNEGKKTFNSLMNRTFDPSQVSSDLNHFAAERAAALSAKFGGMCGNFDKTLSLSSIYTGQDTGCLAPNCCPLQRELFIKGYNSQDRITDKQALTSAQNMLLAVSAWAVLVTGKETISVQTIEQLLDAKETSVTLKEASALTFCYTDAQTRLAHKFYESDETNEIAADGKMTQNMQKVGEKEDLAGGLCFAHYEINVREYRRMKAECTALFLEKARMESALNAPAGGLLKASERLQANFTDMTKIRNKIQYLRGDCEDLAGLLTLGYALAKDRPEKVSAMTLPYVDKQIWASSENNGALKKALWPRMAMFTSKCMKMHQAGEAGGEIDACLAADPTSLALMPKQSIRREVVNGICVANGASLSEKIGLMAGQAVMPLRGDSNNFPDYVKKVCGSKLGGHCCPFQIECGPERDLIDDGHMKAVCFDARIWAGEVLEATKPCKQNLDVKFAGPVKNVDVNICMGDKTLDMKAVPLDIAMNTIGQAFQNNLNAHFKTEKTGLCCAVPMDIAAASSFYSAFSSLGGDVCVSAEVRDDDTGRITSVHTKNMQHVLDTQPENVRYVGAKLAWDVEYGAASHKTEVLCVKFAPSKKELDLISMACQEVGQMHSMSKEQFATIMEMGIRIDCGWSGDTYTSLCPKAQSCPTKMPIEILVRTSEGCLTADNVMKCMTTTQLKQHTEAVLFHHISNALDMDCAGASFRWINQDFGVVMNMVVELGDALK
jgi:hypothetical protein